MSDEAAGNTEALASKRDALARRLAELPGLLVAYSGGIDSALLASVAHSVLGEGMLAVLADSPSLAREQLRDAVAFAEESGIPLRVVGTAEMENELYARNQADRCFHCKDELFTVMERHREALGFRHVAYGLNADDTQDYRPGHGAAANHGVLAPLAEMGLTKAEVRTLAQAAGLRVWDKPASACLASRVEYGRRVTPEVLEQIDRAEAALRGLNLRQFRVRHHGAVARVEIAEEEMDAALERGRLKAIGAAVRDAGFQYVALDCDGYRTGSMNEILPVEVLTKGSKSAKSRSA